MRPVAPLSRVEFIALMAMMFSIIAFSIDSMLPALPEIAATLTPDAPNRAQLVLTSFVLGMGLGTFFTGPLSDTFGRKPVLMAGAALYITGALLGALAQSLDLLLAARVLQGLGAAGPRVVSLAIIRDLYAGRGMAQLMSFVMMIFTLVPALAPSLGALIIYLAGWRGVFVSFILFAVIGTLWLGLRQPETLPVERRRPLHARTLITALKEVFAHPTVRITIMIQTLVFGVLFAMLSSSQQIFDITFDQGANFPFWFGGIAIVSGSASFLNARLVMRLGMRRMVHLALTIQLAVSGTMLVLLASHALAGTMAFAAYVLWQTSVFFMVGLTLGNLNAIAMEPMGHIAGMAASMIGAVSTVAAVLIAAPIGLAFDGTPLPLAIGIFICVTLALLLMRRIREEPSITVA